MPSYEFVVSTGVILVETETTLVEVQDEYKVAFSNTDLVVDSGPLSVLIESETESRDGIASNNAQLANQINPNISSGIFLDAVYALFGAQRVAGTSTTVIATLNGTPATFIPAGSSAQSTEGDIYLSTGDATLDGSGTTTQTFAAEEIGPTLLAVNSLNQIVSGPLGWTNVDNLAPGITGTNTQSDESTRNTRTNLLGLQSIEMAEAIIARVSAVFGVRSMIFRQNDSSTSQIIDGFNMVRNSILAVVDGGTDQAVGDALEISKGAGAAYNGAVNVIVISPASGQPITVLFERPTVLNVFVEVTIDPSSTLTDPLTLTKEAVIAYANGLIDGFLGFVVGSDVNPFDMSNGINAFNSSINALRVEVGFTAVVSAADLPIGITEIATTSDAFITVVEV